MALTDLTLGNSVTLVILQVLIVALLGASTSTIMVLHLAVTRRDLIVTSHSPGFIWTLRLATKFHSPLKLSLSELVQPFSIVS